jgi:RNA polymerase sigma factor (sigma-70 family)
MDDPQVVAAALAGDRNGYAAIYDRYADRIHDFAASILRNRAEASDALQTTFLIAFDHLDQLAEPARLESWLFAVAHRAILDRVPADDGSLAADESGDLAWGTGPSEERLSREELTEFAGQVTAGLDVHDRVLLDLHVRQGLAGRDLASAAGEAPGQVEFGVQRLEAQVERSIGALLVARTGRRSCADLYAILSRWDGRLTPQFRDRVTTHVDDCEVCNSRRRIAPSPLTLMAAAPLSAAPAYLRSVIVGKAQLEALEREAPGRRLAVSSGWAFLRDGFPDLAGRVRGGGLDARGPTGPTGVIGPAFARTQATSVTRSFSPPAETAATTYLPPVERRTSPAGDDRDRRGMLIGAVAGLVILIGGVVILLSSRSHPTKIGVTTTTVTATTPTTDAPISLPPALTATTTATPSTTAANVGRLVVSGDGKPVSLGTATNTAMLTVSNNGSAPVDFTATPNGSGLTVNPLAGSLVPGASQLLTVSFDRTASPPGSYTGSIILTGGGNTQTLTFTAIVDPGPMISSEMAVPPILSATCASPKKTTTTAVTTAMVTAAVTSSQPVQTVVLHWQDPAGANHSAVMTPGGIGGFGYSGTLGPFTTTGSQATVSWYISAIDKAGVASTSDAQVLTVTGCA